MGWDPGNACTTTTNNATVMVQTNNAVLLRGNEFSYIFVSRSGDFHTKPFAAFLDVLLIVRLLVGGLWVVADEAVKSMIFPITILFFNHS